MYGEGEVRYLMKVRGGGYLVGVDRMARGTKELCLRYRDLCRFSKFHVGKVGSFDRFDKTRGAGYTTTNSIKSTLALSCFNIQI